MSSGSTTANLILQDPQKGLKQCYELYGRKLINYAARSWNLEEDVAWDLIYKILFSLKDNVKRYSFESEEKFQSFLFRLFINYIKNHFRDDARKKKGVVEIELDQSHEFLKSENELNEKENPNVFILQEELDKLEEWQRILLLMRSQDVPYSEIAKLLDKPESQLKVYYGRLKNSLFEKMRSKIQIKN